MRRFYGAAYSDVGTVKEVNQDSLTIKITETTYGEAAFAVICDGMGGLEQGELASATVVRTYEDWYRNNLQPLLERCDTREMFARELCAEWTAAATDCNRRIRAYAKEHRTSLGTTLTLFLAIQDTLCVMHVGDCRVYEFTDRGSTQLTKDQTYVAREVELGHMTPEQARSDARRGALLQCIGVNENVAPDFFCKKIGAQAAYLLCTDGFWHIPTVELLHRTCYEEVGLLDWATQTRTSNKDAMRSVLAEIAAHNKRAGERDNLSAILVWTHKRGYYRCSIPKDSKIT